MQAKGIIYAIYTDTTKKLYVGQTLNSAIERFKQHVYAARNGEGLPMYESMRRNGIDRFFIIPLEVIVYEKHPTRTLNRENFTRVATQREQFWVNLLKTWRPLGFNTVWSARRKRCRHSKRNPMKRHRNPQPLPQPMAPILHRRIYGYRNWERRCLFLMNEISRGALIEEKLRTYKNKNLRCMRDYLQRCIFMNYPLGNFPANHFSMYTLLEYIREKVLLPDTHKAPRRTIKDPIVFRLEWNDAMMRSIPVRKIVTEAEDLPVGVDHNRLTEKLIVAKKLIRKAGDVICNYRKAARTYCNYRVPDAQCPCRRLFDSKYRPNDGCVISMDTSITKCRKLEALLNEGAGFREIIKTDMQQALENGLSSLVFKLSKELAVPLEEFDLWANNIREKITPMIRDPQTRSILEDPSVSSSLKFLQANLVICITDKAAKNYTFICRHYYRHVLYEELNQDGGAYTTINDTTSADIFHKFVEELYSPGFKVPKAVHHEVQTKKIDKLPLLYWIPKMHKSPPKARFIAGSSSVMTTKLAKHINAMLLFLKKQLLLKDRTHIRKTGVKRCWFVDNHDTVCRWLRYLDRPNNPAMRCIRSFDSSTMYTTLEHDDLIDSVDSAVKEAFGEHLYLFCNGSTTYWVDKEVNEGAVGNHFTAHQVTHLVKVLVQNTYLKNGDMYKKQEVGLPMGTNPAPSLADLDCYTKESKKMDRLMQSNIAAARNFLGTFRLIDDVLSCDNPHFTQHVLLDNRKDGLEDIPDPIYPPFLRLSQTNEEDTSATYLGMDITSAQTGFHVKVSDAQKRLPFPKINYPSLKGNFPRVLGYGVFVGQLHRFASICTDYKDFLHSCNHLARQLLRKGYVKSRLCHKFSSFINGASFPYRCSKSYLLRQFKMSL